MRIAFFGGSFDPPHLGHLAIARAAADRLQLDRVLVAPVGSQPFKGALSPARYEDRLAMVALAFADDARCEASPLDAPLPDGAHNYTYETLSAYKTRLLQQNTGARLFCLLGADSFHTLAHWHKATELMLLCDFVVAARPGYALKAVASQLPQGIRLCGESAQTHMLQLHLEATAAATSDAQSHASLFILRDLEEDVSATALRQALATGNCEASDRMLAPAVAAYIRKHHLYETTCLEG